MRYEVLTVVAVKRAAFRGVTPCSLSLHKTTILSEVTVIYQYVLWGTGLNNFCTSLLSYLFIINLAVVFISESEKVKFWVLLTVSRILREGGLLFVRARLSNYFGKTWKKMRGTTTTIIIIIIVIIIPSWKMEAAGSYQTTRRHVP